MKATSLTAEERRVVEILREDWRDLLRCTAIHQAMERVGLPFSHASRLRIAEFFIGDAAVSGLIRWAPSTYVLTNNEKLIARRLVRSWREGTSIPQPGDDEWRKSGWDTEQIEDAFKTLAWLGFMRESGGRYEVAEDAESFLQGLGAPDFFIMTYRPARERMLERVSEGARSTAAEGMSEKMLDAIRGVNTSGARALKDSAFYGDERAILNDACGWSDQPIRVVMDHGKLVEIAPDTTWYLLGGD